uniref:DHC_N2 domain-containing protein n=1 Tax=Steinernema glaseri TaxID=37863 RepID=A0A1I7ZLI4_9BILA
MYLPSFMMEPVLKVSKDIQHRIAVQLKNVQKFVEECPEMRPVWMTQRAVENNRVSAFKDHTYNLDFREPWNSG